jgi:hypothetical protein
MSHCYSGWCREGYSGHLCSTCANGWGYSDEKKRVCQKCTDLGTQYYVLAIGLPIVGLLYLVFLMNKTMPLNFDDMVQ